jgi:hypothetical protein
LSCKLDIIKELLTLNSNQHSGGLCDIRKVKATAQEAQGVLECKLSANRLVLSLSNSWKCVGVVFQNHRC